MGLDGDVAVALQGDDLAGPVDLAIGHELAAGGGRPGVLEVHVANEAGKRLAKRDDARAIAARFIAAHAEHWCRFRPVLSVRNMEAERGNTAFQILRRNFFHTMIDILLDAALTLRPADVDSEIEAQSGRIAVAVAAIERLGPAEGLYTDEASPYRRFAPDLLAGAKVDLLAAALRGESGGNDD